MSQKITQFNKNNVDFVRSRLQSAVANVEAELGIKVHFGNIGYRANSMKIQCGVMTVTKGEETLDPRELQAKQNVKVYGNYFGVKPNMLGMTTDLGYKFGTGVLIGCANRRKRYPIIFKSMKTGDLVNTTTDYLKRLS